MSVSGTTATGERPSPGPRWSWYSRDSASGGWAVGEIIEVLTDPAKTVEVFDGALSGNMPVNFGVSYDDGHVEQLLTLDDYATSSSADEGAWVLLVGEKGRGKGKGKGEAAAMAKVDLASMSAAQRAALRAQLDAFDE